MDQTTARENLTKSLGVAFALSEAGPRPGYNVLIYERTRPSGRQFVETLDDTHIHRRRALSRFRWQRERYESFAVSRDTEFSHAWSSEYLTVDGLGPLSVEIHLYFSVAEPLVVADNLDADPVGKVGEEAIRVVDRVISRLTWDHILARLAELEELILDLTEVEGSRGTGRDRIQQLGLLQGLRVSRIEVTTRLPSKVGEENEDVREAHAKREPELARVRHDALVERLKNREANMKRVTDAVVDQFVDRVGDYVRGNEIEVLGELFRASADGGARTLGGLRELRPARLSGEVSKGSLSSRTQVLEALSDGLSCGAELRSRFLSTGMRLLGEARAGSSSDDEDVTQLIAEMHQVIDELRESGAVIDGDQDQELLEWTEYEELRDAFAQDDSEAS